MFAKEQHVVPALRGRAYSNTDFEKLLIERVAPELAATNIPFYVIRWQDGEETLHDRYILTDIAGVSVLQGLSECRANELDTTEVALLGQSAYERRRSQYSAGNQGCFKFVDGWGVKGGEVFMVAIEGGEFIVKP